MSRVAAAPGAFSRILIVRLSSVGDVVMALPALEGLRAAYPTAHIAWVVERRARNLLEGHPALDEIIDFPRSKWREQWKRRCGFVRSLPAMSRWFRELRRKDFDLSLDFQGNLKSGACTFAAGAKIRIGYAKDECREPNWLFTNRRLSLGGQGIHRVDRDLLLAGLAGVPFRFRRPRIRFEADDRKVGEEVVAQPGAGPPVVVLHPGTSNFMPHKRWPIASYARLGDELVRRLSARVIVSWGPGEESMADALHRSMRERSEILPPTPSMKSLGFVLSRADLVVGSDTGPVHLAVVMGVDTLVLLGPGDPRHYYPRGHPDRCFYHRAPCSPCRHRGCLDLQCMISIAPDAVAAKAEEVLRGRRVAASGA